MDENTPPKGLISEGRDMDVLRKEADASKKYGKLFKHNMEKVHVFIMARPSTYMIGAAGPQKKK